MSKYILLGFVCYLIGAVSGLTQSEKKVKKWIDHKVFELDGKVYKIEEFKTEE